jgi:hypothetical protein
MLLFSQGCLDLDVSGNIITIKQKLRKYFPHRGFAERCPQNNNIYNNSHRGFVERCPHDNDIYNNSRRGFVERYPC